MEKHAKIEVFAFYLNDGHVEEFCDLILSSLNNFIHSQAWSIEYPYIVLSDQPSEDGYKIAGELKIYSAKYGKLDPSLDKASYIDVVRIVDFLSELSSKYDVEIEFELDGVFVGSISGGKKSNTLVIGLLDEWRKQLKI